MDDIKDLFGERIVNEREPVSSHDINPVFDDLVDLRRRTRKCTRNKPFHDLSVYDAILAGGQARKKLQ